VDVRFSHQTISRLQSLSLCLVVLLGCAKGQEVGPGEVVFLVPRAQGANAPDASPDAGSEPQAEGITVTVPEQNATITPPPNIDASAVVNPTDAGNLDATTGSAGDSGG
jgi:hypothetical protein